MSVALIHTTIGVRGAVEREVSRFPDRRTAEAWMAKHLRTDAKGYTLREVAG